MENEDEWLQEFRRRSYRIFKEERIENSELFKKYNLLDIDFDKVEVRNRRREIDIDLNRDLNYFILNGGLESGVKNDSSKAGLIIQDITVALKKYETLIRPYFNVDYEKLPSFVNSFFDTGVFIYIPKNLELSLPIIGFSILDGTTVAKNFIYVESNSRVNIMINRFGGYEDSLDAEGWTIVLGRNSTATIYDLQTYDSGRFIQIQDIICEDDATFRLNKVFLGSSITKTRTNIYLKGVGSLAENIEVSYGERDQKFDLTTNLIHLGRDTVAKSLNRNALRESSRSLFKGIIRILSNSKNSNSYLASHSLLLDKEASADAIPSLEIETNDVKATHSSSSSSIDREQLFYLMSRGLEMSSAVKLIALGFLSHAINNFTSKFVKDLALKYVDNKWEHKRFSIKDIEFESFESRFEEERTSVKDIFEMHYKYR